MASFQIHEDKENYKQHVKHNYAGVQEKKIIGKKCTENRVTFQTLNNGIRQNAKRTKLMEKKNDEKKLKMDTEVVKNENNDILCLTTCFYKTEIDDEMPYGKDDERDGFPLSLYNNDEYRKSIWKYLTQKEREDPRAKSNYMLKQIDLCWNTRSILIDWLVSVAEEYKFCDQTFHLSVNYIDRFLSQISVVRTKFQLVGAASMMIAAKMEEYQAINSQEWSYLTGDTFTSRQILKMEQLILKALRFKMQPPTTYEFIQHLSAEFKMDTKTINLAMYICELVLLEGEDYLDHFPSKLAAASIALARHTLAKRKPWPEKLEKASGYTYKELSPVVQRQQQTFRDSPLKEQQAIQSKYKSDKYNRVALLKPRSLLLEEFDDEE